MNITSALASPVGRALPAPAAKPVEAVDATPGAPAAKPSDPSKPLFSGGLVNWDTLMTPETLGALFALDDKGQVQFNESWAPRLRDGQYIDTPEERLLAQRVRNEHMQEIGVKLPYVPNVTDDQKEFFRRVTGYNLVVIGPTYGVYDDEGNMLLDQQPGGGASSPPWQLAHDLVDNSLADGENEAIDADWYAKFTEKMKSAGLGIPAEWAVRAKEYFDETLAELVGGASGEERAGTTRR